MQGWPRDQFCGLALGGLLESILYWFEAMLLMSEMNPFSASHREGYFLTELMSTRPFLDLKRNPHFRRPREWVTQYSSTGLLVLIKSLVLSLPAWPDRQRLDRFTVNFVH